MSIVLSATPPLLSFSGDRIAAKFTCTDIFSQNAGKSVNKIPLGDPIYVGDTIHIRYGGKEVIMTAGAITDSGTGYFATEYFPVIPEAQLQCFKDNYQLSKDFDITIVGDVLTFTAKLPGTSFNMTNYNTTSGSIEKLKSNYGVQFRLFLENVDNTEFYMISETFLNVQIGETNIVEAPIGDKLHTEISDEIRKNLPEIPNGALLCKRSCRRYYFEYAESYNDQVRKVQTSEIKTVLHGGFSAIGQATKSIENIINPASGFKRFLKQGGNISSTRTDQKQYLYYYNSGPTLNAYIKCRLRFTDGSKQVSDLYMHTLLANRKYCFSADYKWVFSPSSYPGKTLLAYEIWISDPDGKKVSETQTFLLDYKYKPYVRYFLNWSSWGSFDSRAFYGKGSLEFDLTQSVADKGYYNSSEISKGASIVYNTTIKSKFSLTTGFIQDRQKLLYNRDFFISALKYRSIGADLLPIVVTSKTIPELNDGINLFAQKFDYEYLFDDHAYTEGDIYEPGVSYDEQALSGIKYLTDKERIFLLTTEQQYITI